MVQHGILRKRISRVGISDKKTKTNWCAWAGWYATVANDHQQQGKERRGEEWSWYVSEDEVNERKRNLCMMITLFLSITQAQVTWINVEHWAIPYTSLTCTFIHISSSMLSTATWQHDNRLDSLNKEERIIKIPLSGLWMYSATSVWVRSISLLSSRQLSCALLWYFRSHGYVVCIDHKDLEAGHNSLFLLFRTVEFHVGFDNHYRTYNYLAKRTYIEFFFSVAQGVYCEGSYDCSASVGIPKVQQDSS